MMSKYGKGSACLRSTPTLRCGLVRYPNEALYVHTMHVAVALEAHTYTFFSSLSWSISLVLDCQPV